MKNIKTQLQKYAELAVKVGINLQEQEGLIISANTEAMPLVRLIAEEAYKAGAKHVELMLGDEYIAIARYLQGHEAIFGTYPQWKLDAMETMYKENYHHMSVLCDDPDLLKDIDPDLVARDSAGRSTLMQPIREYRMNGTVKWNIVAMPSKAWAKKVYPNLEESEAIDALWDKIFAACRIDTDNPIQAWKDHVAALKRREAYLNEKAFEKLVYKGEGTDLEVYLADGHKWLGGSSFAKDGQEFLPNIPTEEVFTAPHMLKVNGTLKSTKPLSYRGRLINDFGFTFKDGVVVDFYAEEGYDVLKKMIETDEGARRLGEVALVADDSPISNTGVLFSNTLFDENASCHFALGMAYPTNFLEADKASKDELIERGANTSKIHVDFMVGSKDLSITAYTKAGEAVQLFEKGNWVI